MASIKQILGKVNPKLYADNGKELLKKYKKVDKIPVDEIKAKPLSEHKIIYDSSTETLEPVYFFILDLMRDMGLNPEKLVDNFASSPGSSHFSEMGQRATIMQQQGQKILGDVNTVLRSVLNIVYDLKEFRIRLEHYNHVDSRDKEVAIAARLSLKQIWMDKVDINKQNSSIKAMALGQGGFQTLLDAFLISDTEKDVLKLDLNEKVKRILFPRIQEFNIWLQESEKELRKRYELERTYLGSQVNSLKLYSRWAKPYLKAAQQLESEDRSKSPDLVKTFNTILLELTLFGKSKLDIPGAVSLGELPIDLKKMKFKRDYFSCVLVDLRFRGIPGRLPQQQGYTFGGKAEITFSSYALNNDEFEKFKKELEKDDLEDVLKLIDGATTESLDKLQEDINSFLEDKSKKKTSKQGDNSNPLLALIGFYNNKFEDEKDGKKEGDEKGENKKTKDKLIRPDDWIEKTLLRPMVSEKSKETTFDLFDIYKGAHGMPSYT